MCSVKAFAASLFHNKIGSLSCVRFNLISFCNLRLDYVSSLEGNFCR